MKAIKLQNYKAFSS